MSVIIPVYNDAERLRPCLTALEAQTYPAAAYEVIVVDNGSTDRAREVAVAFPRVRLVSEPAVGAYAARNRGIAVARGDVLAFTDADCIPSVAWIENGVATLRRHEGCGLVGGAVQIRYRSPAHPTARELYEALFDFDQERSIAHGRFAMTANLFTWAAVVRAIGAFDGSLKSGGDREWGNRAVATGYGRAFSDATLVWHPPRPSLRALWEKRLRVAGGHYDLARKRRFARIRALAALTQQLFRKPLRGAAKVLSARLAIGVGTRVRLLVLVVLLAWAEVLERIRLEAGGRSRR